MAKRSPPRNREETLNRIYENCLELTAEVGIENLRTEDIAKRCRISRPLLNHYFPVDLMQSLRQFMIERVLEEFKNYVDDSIREDTHPERILKSYVRAHFKWVKENPAKSGVLLAFFPKCVSHEELRHANTASVLSGLRRLETLLYFKFKDEKRIPMIARSFQIFLTGALLSHVTEDHPGRREMEPEKLVLDFLDLFDDG